MTKQEAFITAVEKRLDEILSSPVLNGGDQTVNPLAEGMSYAVVGGGKRVRPTAAYLAFKAVGGADYTDALVDYACALELVHSYSLVHDDLPAMDNDDVRRGKPSTHKRFGEAQGILIGDALLTAAMKVLSSGGAAYGVEFCRAAEKLSASAMEMAAGQSIDLRLADGTEVPSVKNYVLCYRLKTGALIKAAFVGGAILAKGSDEEIKNAESYAESVGLLFQLGDDMLDGDKGNSLLTVAGEDVCRRIMDEEYAKATEVAARFKSPEPLQTFANSLIGRSK